VAALRQHFDFESCCGRCTPCMRSLINRHPATHQRTHTGVSSCKVTNK
jgi:bacterioferritin-associated ferredoxin